MDALTKTINTEVSSHLQGENIALLLLVGSVARGQSDELSDYDYYAITRSVGRDEQKQLDIQDRKVEILFDTQDTVQAYLAREKNALYRNVSSMLADSIFVNGDEDLAESLRSVAMGNIQSKTVLSQAERLQYLASANDFFDDLVRAERSNDKVSSLLCAKQFLDAALPLLVCTMGTYMQKPNLLSEWIKANQPHIYFMLKQIATSYDLGAANKLLTLIQR